MLQADKLSVATAVKPALSVLMLAAEHAGFAGAKVGGMADVIEGIVPALAAQGVSASVVMPGYGFLPRTLELGDPCRFSVPFRHGVEQIALYAWLDSQTGAQVYLLEHPLWHSAPGKLYISSAPGRPFADDADRFALFGAAVAEALTLGLIAAPDRLHVHDWHQGFFALLRALDPRYQSLKAIPLVLSVHNLALQGTRPLEQESSSLAAWYPWLGLGQATAPSWLRDPRFGHCFNPLRSAIQCADMLHLVSPHYCTEVVKASEPSRGFVGGEGLEVDLQRLSEQGRLIGILNGCDYPASVTPPQGAKDSLGPARALPQVELSPLLQSSMSLQSSTPLPSLSPLEQSQLQSRLLFRAAFKALARAQGRAGPAMAVDVLAQLRLLETQLDWDNAATKPFLLTSVGRLTAQKVGLLCLTVNGKTVLETLLSSLADFDAQGRFMLLGSGDSAIAEAFQAIAAKYDNFIFINQFDLELSAALYRAGSLFLMPSTFEPCGISQMLAMREGQPCLVSRVGGLVDTVQDGHNGWSFGGDTAQQQADNLCQTFAALLKRYRTPDWQRVANNAKGSRFSWQDAASAYRQRLYSLSVQALL